MLRRHRHLRGEYVFCLEDGTRISALVMQKALTRISKRAGMRELSWYVFRHTFASHLMMRGMPIKAVGDLLGHSTIEMTMRYAHLTPAIRRDVVQSLDAPPPEHSGSTEKKASSENA